MKLRFSPREIYTQIRTQGLSMQRRFTLLLVAVVMSTLAALIVVLDLMGILNSTEQQKWQTAQQQLAFSTGKILDDMDELAACAASFSEELTEILSQRGTVVSDLTDDVDALTDLQRETYDTVYSYLRQADCSGAFYLLNTTVNDALADTYYNGIYLKVANLNSDNTIRRSVRMYRGSSVVAREQNTNLHSRWECETKAGSFPQVESVMSQEQADPARGYLLTAVYQLPQTWEWARFLCAPVQDAEGAIVGVCGFEISDMFFKLRFDLTGEGADYLMCALLTSHGTPAKDYTAQTAGVFAPEITTPVSLENGSQYATLTAGKESFVGKVSTVTVGNSRHVVAVTLSETLYRAYLRQEQNITIAVLICSLLVAVGAGILLGRRYVRPILQTMEALKTDRPAQEETRIPELDALRGHFDVQHRRTEAMLEEMRQRTDTTRQSLDQLQQEHERLQQRLDQVVETKREQVYPEEYTYFLQAINDLSGKERTVFDCYLKGLSTRETANLMGITEDGVRYHNKNLYTKLGVTGIKQMKMFISIMQQDM